MFKKSKEIEFSNGHYHQLSTLDLIRQLIISKLPKQKESFSKPKKTLPPPPEDVKINHIAIILDGVVEETIHCQDRLTALLLSNPDFVEYDEESDEVILGSTEYIDNKFINKEKELMSDDEIAESLKNMGAEIDDKN